jgi:integrase
MPNQRKNRNDIADCGQTLAIKASIIMKAGLRPVELHNLKVKDFDHEQRILYPSTAKNGAPRKIKIDQSLADLIKAHIVRNNRQQNETIFKGNPVATGDQFRETRNRVADKLNDQSLRTVRLYDLRHYFATTDYCKFQDIKRTQYLMGHKHSSTTDIYTHLLDNGEENEFTCKTASNLKEATQLIESGFQYITEMDGVKIFKKRK